ncbi:glutamine amidotransferase [Micromonospora pisi]|uniref:Gamma-glutamyl-hercynylcysteine sulfoxide hydrolase n=1 Tax=Micromonospora pisi TaxID=589240 RepID=A0A495JCC7_9ACTN|nr:ergothioneine biosynthesis protein EgtC [Micromonospora pisi]RKR86034.1 glutamine amidotransferase [Micromonospora pisi]
MCRHLVYLGPPVPLAALLFDPPHGLVHQSWAPREMRGGGTVNADGFGVAWYPATATGSDSGWQTDSGSGSAPGTGAGTGEPARYRRAIPIWADAALPALAASTRSGAVLAAVRSATVGMPVVETAAAPFSDGRWLFSHNGMVPGWPDTLVGLAAELPTRDLLTLDAPTDAALLWALVRQRLRSGTSPERAVAETVRAVADAAPGARLNLLLTDGRTAVASAAGHALSVRAGAGSTLICSEPLDDDPAWAGVPDGHLVVATIDDVHLRPIGELV